jgi:hypothetical protein
MQYSLSIAQSLGNGLIVDIYKNANEPLLIHVFAMCNSIKCIYKNNILLI